MNKREKTVRFSLVGATLTLFLGLWGALYSHDSSGSANFASTGPVAATADAATTVEQPLPAATASQTSQAQTAPKAQAVTQPAARVHTRTRAS